MDVSEFSHRHPGGARLILNAVGTDVTHELLGEDSSAGHVMSFNPHHHPPVGLARPRLIWFRGPRPCVARCCGTDVFRGRWLSVPAADAACRNPGDADDRPLGGCLQEEEEALPGAVTPPRVFLEGPAGWCEMGRSVRSEPSRGVLRWCRRRWWMGRSKLAPRIGLFLGSAGGKNGLKGLVLVGMVDGLRGSSISSRGSSSPALIAGSHALRRRSDGWVWCANCAVPSGLSAG